MNTAEVSPGPVYAAALMPAPIVGTADRPLLVVFEAAQAAQWQAMATQAGALAITDAASFDAANALLVTLHNAGKEVEARKAALKRPVIDTGKAIDQVVARVAEPLDAAKRSLQGKVAAYQAEQRRIADEARRKAEEAARIEREKAEAERARAQAEADAKHAAAVAAAKAAAQAEADELAALLGTASAPVEVVVAPAPVIQARKVEVQQVAEAPRSSAVVTRMVPTLEIADASLIPISIGGIELRPVDTAAVKRAIAAGLVVPGAAMVDKPTNAMARGKS